MGLNSPAAYGMYSESIALHHVVQALKQSGFHKEDICMLVSPSDPLASIVREGSALETQSHGDAAIAGLMGWLFEFGAVMIPTVGFFIRSQAFLRALVNGDSSSRYGRTRTLVGLGFPQRDAERFENRLRDVGVLIYVTCPEETKAASALEILRRTGAENPAVLALGAAVGAAA